MSISLLLSRLDKVRERGSASWSACCPAHEDRAPSLSIRECEDGRVLLHCFAGCAVQDVVAAVGMELSDLFPEKLPDMDYEGGRKSARPRINPWDVLNSLKHELIVIGIASAELAGKLDGVPGTDEQVDALLQSANHIVDLLESAHAIR